MKVQKMYGQDGIANQMYETEGSKQTEKVVAGCNGWDHQKVRKVQAMYRKQSMEVVKTIADLQRKKRVERYRERCLYKLQFARFYFTFAFALVHCFF